MRTQEYGNWDYILFALSGVAIIGMILSSINSPVFLLSATVTSISMLILLSKRIHREQRTSSYSIYTRTGNMIAYTLMAFATIVIYVFLFFRETEMANTIRSLQPWLILFGPFFLALNNSTRNLTIKTQRRLFVVHTTLLCIGVLAAIWFSL